MTGSPQHDDPPSIMPKWMADVALAIAITVLLVPIIAVLVVTLAPTGAPILVWLDQSFPRTRDLTQIGILVVATVWAVAMLLRPPQHGRDASAGSPAPMSSAIKSVTTARVDAVVGYKEDANPGEIDWIVSETRRIGQEFRVSSLADIRSADEIPGRLRMVMAQRFDASRGIAKLLKVKEDQILGEVQAIAEAAAALRGDDPGERISIRLRRYFESSLPVGKEPIAASPPRRVVPSEIKDQPTPILTMDVRPETRRSEPEHEVDFRQALRRFLPRWKECADGTEPQTEYVQAVELWSVARTLVDIESGANPPPPVHSFQEMMDFLLKFGGLSTVFRAALILRSIFPDQQEHYAFVLQTEKAIQDLCENRNCQILVPDLFADLRQLGCRHLPVPAPKSITSSPRYKNAISERIGGLSHVKVVDIHRAGLQCGGTLLSRPAVITFSPGDWI